MPEISSAVYDPPREGLPTLTVVLGADGNVRLARCATSRQEAQMLLGEIQKSVHATISKELGRRG